MTIIYSKLCINQLVESGDDKGWEGQEGLGNDGNDGQGPGLIVKVCDDVIAATMTAVPCAQRGTFSNGLKSRMTHFLSSFLKISCRGSSKFNFLATF